MLRVLPTEGLSILTKLKISIGPTPPPDLCFYEAPLRINIDELHDLLLHFIGRIGYRRPQNQLSISRKFTKKKKTIRLLKIDQRYEHKWISEARIRAEPGPIDSISRRDPPNNAKTKRSDLNTTKIQINTHEIYALHPRALSDTSHPRYTT
jgi:hypothetical protein